MNVKTVSIAFALLGAVASASATELVTNGGFEATPLGSGWSWTSNGAYSLADDIGNWNGQADPIALPTKTLWMGGYAEIDGMSSSDDLLTQSINSTGYTSATLSLDLVSDGYDFARASNPYDYISISYGSHLLQKIDLGNGGDPFKLNLSYDISAYLGGSSDLKILVHNDDTFDTSAYIDNVSIKASAVPEPATMAALGLGVAAMLRRRKKS